jgi:hypothetical protein
MRHPFCKTVLELIKGVLMGEFMRKSTLAAVMGLVFISGCAKESDSKPAPPAKTKQNVAVAAGTSAEVTTGTLVTAGSSNLVVESPATEGKLPKKVGPHRPAKKTVDVYAPQGNPASPQSSGQGPGTPIPSGQFSGAANDYLPQVLRLRIERETNVELRAANLARAQSIQNVEFFKAGRKTNLVVNLRVNGAAHGLSKVSLRGELNENSEGQLRGANKFLAASAKLKCFDQNPNGKCETVVATIQITEAKKLSTVIVILRKSSAIFDVKLPNENVTDPSYITLVRMFKNTAYNLKTEDSFKSLNLESFEVVNGISNEKLIVVGRNSEILQVTFPLSKQLDEERMSVKADTTLAIEEALRISEGNSFSTHIAEKITSAELIENNGFGVIGLSLKMAALENLPQDEIILRLTRKIKKVAY